MWTYQDLGNASSYPCVAPYANIPPVSIPLHFTACTQRVHKVFNYFDWYKTLIKYICVYIYVCTYIMTESSKKWINRCGEVSSYCYFKNHSWVIKYNPRWTLDALAGKGLFKKSTCLSVLSCRSGHCRHVQTVSDWMDAVYSTVWKHWSCFDGREKKYWQIS